MNILILNWRDIKNPKSGGAEIVTMEHARAWVKRGHNVTWFTSKFENCKKVELINGVNIVRRGNFLTVYPLASFFYLVSGQKFDIVIDEIHGLPFFTPLYVKKPKLAFIHEVADEIWDYMFPFPVSKIGKLIEPLMYFVYKNIRFITVSSSTKNDLIKHGVKKMNISIILNGSDTKLLKTYPKKEEIPTFIFVSRVVRMKGIEDVLRAFFYILREVKDANLWIVGDGEKRYIEELKEIIKEYSIFSKIRFFGKVSDEKKHYLMKKAKLMLHASVKEGWGLVVIEAASQGTPSVVYSVAGLKDSVKNGKTGIVLRENSSKEMAKQVVALINNKKKYEAFQKNCFSWAESLTWKKSTQQSTALVEYVASLR